MSRIRAATSALIAAIFCLSGLSNSPRGGIPYEKTHQVAFN